MKLSARSEYACLSMMALSRSYGKRRVKIEELSEGEGIPRKYLEQILLQLNRAGYLKSWRGAAGGYELRMPPAQISLADVVRLMDGALAPVESVSQHFYSHTPIERSRPLMEFFRGVRDWVADRMENTSFADLLSAGEKSENVRLRTERKRKVCR